MAKGVDVKEKAKKLGIAVNAKMDKIALVKAIQQKEGFTACFATAAVKTCNQMSCCWRQDCLTFQKA
jgi:hypothetical protein